MVILSLAAQMSVPLYVGYVQDYLMEGEETGMTKINDMSVVFAGIIIFSAICTFARSTMLAKIAATISKELR